jgi:uncharacterized membrane protein
VHHLGKCRGAKDEYSINDIDDSNVKGEINIGFFNQKTSEQLFNDL